MKIKGVVVVSRDSSISERIPFVSFFIGAFAMVILQFFDFEVYRSESFFLGRDIYRIIIYYSSMLFLCLFYLWSIVFLVIRKNKDGRVGLYSLLSCLLHGGYVFGMFVAFIIIRGS